LLRAMSLSNGRWTFYEAVNLDKPILGDYFLGELLYKVYSRFPPSLGRQGAKEIHEHGFR
jgi:hypothetical protein